MFAVRQNLLGDLFTFKVSFDSREEAETFKKELEYQASKAKFEVIELKDTFLCKFCNQFYDYKHYQKDECMICGVERCEFCEDSGICECNEEDFYDEW